MTMIAVMGTGQSGTSVTAQLCAAMGVNFCGHDFVTDGAWKYMECQEWHAVLQSVIDQGLVTEEIVRAVRALIASHRSPGVWGVKATGFCFAIPVVHEALDGEDLRVIAAHRTFSATVRAVNTRASYTRSHAERHVIRMQRAMFDSLSRIGRMGVPVHHVQYEEVVAQPTVAADRLAAFLGTYADNAHLLVDPTLNHHGDISASRVAA